MKRLLFFLLSFLMISCKQFDIFYYQVLSVESDNVQFKEVNYLYENDDVKIIYDMWSDRGDPGFTIYNKSDKTIYLNLEETQFIYNGYANDYYKNRTFSYNTSKSIGLNVNTTDYNLNPWYRSKYQSFMSTSSAGLQSDYSVDKGTSYQEKKVIVVPPKTFRNITEFNIPDVPFRDCQILRFPKEGEEKTIKYNMEESPYKFSNVIKYSYEKSFQNQVTIRNNFWVTEITNLNYHLFYFDKLSTNCEGQNYYKEYSPLKQSNRLMIITDC
ncbi:MAG: hypothetical protein M1419_08275 [Bacteroidetes bacterium]|nr:hypothetical protein [Bacteroidota bacterium]